MTAATLGKTHCLYPELETQLLNWIKTRDVPAALLLGSPGVGKTTLAHRIFELSQ